MRKTLLPLLLASALVPAAAFAQDEGQERGTRPHGERSSQRDNGEDARPQRSERVQRTVPATRTEHAEPAAKAERTTNRAARPAGVEPVAKANRSTDPAQRNIQSGDPERAVRSDRMQRADRPARAERPAHTEPVESDQEPAQQVQAPVTAQPGQQTESRSDSLVEGFRRVGRDNASGGDGDHDAHDRDDDHDWSRDWRKDRRYDWWGYRNRYSSLFRLGRYYDPYGWRYRHWSIGYSLWPSYYGSSFWLDDPWRYRLPPAYGPYRWVRYYDDALLVNIYTGHVVDTIYNFFW